MAVSVAETGSAGLAEGPFMKKKAKKVVKPTARSIMLSKRAAAARAIDPLRNQFYDHLHHASCKLSGASGATYFYGVDIFFRYLKAKGIMRLSKKVLEDFQREISRDYNERQALWRDKKRGKKFSIHYQNIIAAALRYFFSWARKQKMIDYKPHIPTTKASPPTPEALRPAQIRYVLKLAKDKLGAAKKNARQWFSAWQAYALVSVLAHTGIRIAEAVNLQWSELLEADKKNGPRLEIGKGKGSKQRFVDVNPHLLRVLFEYRDVCRRYGKMGTGNFGPMFPSAKNETGSLTVRAGELITQRLYIEAIGKRPGLFSGMKRINPHLFRHSIATILVRKKTEPAVVQKILGHANLATTERYYIHRDPRQMQRTMKRFGDLIR